MGKLVDETGAWIEPDPSVLTPDPAPYREQAERIVEATVPLRFCLREAIATALASLAAEKDGEIEALKAKEDRNIFAKIFKDQLAEIREINTLRNLAVSADERADDAEAEVARLTS